MIVDCIVSISVFLWWNWLLVKFLLSQYQYVVWVNLQFSVYIWFKYDLVEVTFFHEPNIFSW